MQKENLKPALVSCLLTLGEPIQHPPALQEALERNRRALLCAALLFKPEEISGVLVDSQHGPQLRVNLQNTELDRKFKSPRPPVSVLATFAEWQAELALTPHLLKKLAPMLHRVAPALLTPES